ncbi:three component ABC system middle component [Emticicia sp. 17c]|uniref:three component ABC system middle component n=1 Tax=Emticicia sp. 17c TaxID=3127704 RepID=UPI00301DB1D4
MKSIWEERNPIVANLFNPAFCGEVLRVAISNYNKNSSTNFPFAFSFIILPILLHEETRNKMPKTTKTYLFVWVEENDNLFFDFAIRARSMVKYTKEAISFLLMYEKININEDGEIIANDKRNTPIVSEDYAEYNNILKKAEMLGKWLAVTKNVKSIYSFFRILP